MPEDLIESALKESDPEGTVPKEATLEESDNGLTPAEMAEEDFYLEGPYLIFTEVFHRKRGFCCNSGCRHCPYL